MRTTPITVNLPLVNMAFVDGAGKLTEYGRSMLNGLRNRTGGSDGISSSDLLDDIGLSDPLTIQETLDPSALDYGPEDFPNCQNGSFDTPSELVSNQPPEEFLEPSETNQKQFDAFSVLSSQELSISAASALYANRMHVCAGTASDYAVTLPPAAGNVGRFVGVRMAPGLTRWVTLTASGADLIDGAATRIMWRNESATLYSDGVSWTKVAGKSIPVSAVMRRVAIQVMAASVWSQIVMDTIASDSTAGLATPFASTTTGRVLTPRPSTYTVSTFATVVAVPAGVVCAGGVLRNSTTPSDDPNGFVAYPVQGGVFYPNASAVVAAGAGEYLASGIYNGNGSGLNTGNSAGNYPTLSVSEIPTW